MNELREAEAALDLVAARKNGRVWNHKDGTYTVYDPETKEAVVNVWSTTKGWDARWLRREESLEGSPLKNGNLTYDGGDEPDEGCYYSTHDDEEGSLHPVAVFPVECDGGYTLIFVGRNSEQYSFDEADEMWTIHADFRGPFATAEEANEAMYDFIAQTPGCGHFPDKNGGISRA